MRRISKDSTEFKNFKKAVERNKLRNKGTSIDLMVSTLKEKNIKLSTLNSR